MNIVITGPRGSGKTALIKESLPKYGKYFIVDFYDEYKQEDYPNSKIVRDRSTAVKEFTEHQRMQRHIPFDWYVVDNTSRLNAWWPARYILNSITVWHTHSDINNGLHERMIFDLGKDTDTWREKWQKHYYELKKIINPINKKLLLLCD